MEEAVTNLVSMLTIILQVWEHNEFTETPLQWVGNKIPLEAMKITIVSSHTPNLKCVNKLVSIEDKMNSFAAEMFKNYAKGKIEET